MTEEKQKTYKELINIVLSVKDNRSELLNKVLQGDTDSLTYLKDTIKDRLAYIKELGGSVEIQKIFITPEEKEAVERHIDEFISDSYTYNR